MLGLKETGWRKEDCDNLVRVINDPLGSPESRLGDLFVSARELAYWGYLHLRKGNINGNQVIPAAVIELAASVQSPNFADKELPQNGFLWQVKDREAGRSEIGGKVPNGSFQIIDITGPLVLVIPEYDLVVVRMYSKLYNYGGPNGDNYLFYLREFGNKVCECVKSLPPQ